MKLNEIYVVNVVNIDNLVYISRKVHLHFVLHTAYSHTRITEFGGKYFPNRSLLFVFILFTEMVACVVWCLTIVIRTVIIKSNSEWILYPDSAVLIRSRGKRRALAPFYILIIDCFLYYFRTFLLGGGNIPCYGQYGHKPCSTRRSPFLQWSQIQKDPSFTSLLLLISIKVCYQELIIFIKNQSNKAVSKCFAPTNSGILCLSREHSKSYFVQVTL